MKSNSEFSETTDNKNKSILGKRTRSDMYKPQPPPGPPPGYSPVPPIEHPEEEFTEHPSDVISDWFEETFTQKHREEFNKISKTDKLFNIVALDQFKFYMDTDYKNFTNSSAKRVVDGILATFQDACYHAGTEKNDFSGHVQIFLRSVVTEDSVIACKKLVSILNINK